MRFSVIVIGLLLSLPCFAAPGTHTVSLTWNASPTPSVTYNVYRSATTNSCGTTKIASGLNLLLYVDTTVINGQTYFYTVSAQISGGESTCSNEVQIAVPTPALAPSNLQGTVN